MPSSPPPYPLLVDKPTKPPAFSTFGKGGSVSSNVTTPGRPNLLSARSQSSAGGDDWSDNEDSLFSSKADKNPPLVKLQGRMLCHAHWELYFNTLGPKQNDRHFADKLFKRISLNKNV